MQHSHRDSKGRFVSVKGTKNTRKRKTKKNSSKVESKSYSTNITVILDRSGSMDSCKTGMEKAFDSFIQEQRKVEGECKVSLVQFDIEYEEVYSDLDIQNIPKLHLQPRNMTALYDAIGKTIVNMKTKYSTKTFDKIICIIITDGYENASHEYSLQNVSEMIKQGQKDGWQFVFLGANINVEHVRTSLGIRGSSAASYQSTNVGTQCAVDSLSNAIKRYRTSDSGFFELTSEEKARMASGKF